MTEINTTTEKIIRALASKVVEPNVKDFAAEIGISLSELNSQLTTLEIYKVAKFYHTPIRNTIRRMAKFGEVIQMGGLVEFLANENKVVNQQGGCQIEPETSLETQKLISLLTSNLRHELMDETIEFKKTLLENQNAFFLSSTKRNKQQILYFWIAIIISLISLIVSIFKDLL